MNVGRKVLVSRKLFCFLCQIRRRARIHQHDLSVCISKLARILHEIVKLALAVGALIARITSQDDQHNLSVREYAPEVEW